jgi:hypothetical protein
MKHRYRVVGCGWVAIVPGAGHKARFPDGTDL